MVKEGDKWDQFRLAKIEIGNMQSMSFVNTKKITSMLSKRLKRYD